MNFILTLFSWVLVIAFIMVVFKLASLAVAGLGYGLLLMLAL